MINDYKNVSFKNNGKLKLLIIAGTRPEIIRLSCIIEKCRRYFDCILAHTGQNYDRMLCDVFFEELDIGVPEVYMNAVGDDLGETVGNIINCSYKLMMQIQPDALLVLGDTNSCLSAISAKRLHIPIFHMEAGNRCKDERLPEETNRKIVDVISDVNMAYSEHARRYLLGCGCREEYTFVVGSPMYEVLKHNFNRIQDSKILSELGLEKEKYILLSAHREENVDDEKALRELIESVGVTAEKYGVKVLYSCHPRSAKRIKEFGIDIPQSFIMHEPFGFYDYNNLQMNSFAVLSDSGTLPEEADFFMSVGNPVAAVSLRSSSERPEAIDAGAFQISGCGVQSVLCATELALDMKNSCDNCDRVEFYNSDNVSSKIVKIIQGYTGIINENVWRKGK